jgi:hypothetical protein
VPSILVRAGRWCVIVGFIAAVAWSVGPADRDTVGYASATTIQGQRTYDSPEEAAIDLGDALRREDDARTSAILGPTEERLVELTGFDRTVRRALGHESLERLMLDYVEERCVFLRLGMSAWELPVPVVRVGSRWLFQLGDDPFCASAGD